MKNPKQIVIYRTIYLILLFFPLPILAQFFGTVPGPGINTSFESTAPGVYSASNSVAGWTITSTSNTSCANPLVWNPGSPEFTVCSTPILNLPYIGNLPQAPMGGNCVRMNNSTANSSVTKIAQTFSITSNFSSMAFSYAGIWQDGSHPCCSQAGFKVQLKDCLGNLLPCPTYSLAGPNCQYVPNYTVQSNHSWTNWQTQYLDLQPYFGTCVTVEAIVNDCTVGDHYGTTFFDAYTFLPAPGTMDLTGVFYPMSTVINYCPGTTSLHLSAPVYQNNFIYTWTAPAGVLLAPNQASTSVITATNPLPGQVYTVSIWMPPLCPTIITYTLQQSNMSIGAIWSSPTCFGGASGSATVSPSIMQPSYAYNWTNSLSVSVGTTQSVYGLAAGVYSVFVSSPSSPGCGTAVATVTVNSLPQNNVINIYKPYCGNEAYLCGGAGSNYQWYNGTVAIAPPLGTAQCYTVTSPINGSLFHLKYNSIQGCQDSIRFTLGASAPGNLAITNSTYTCPGSSIGSAIITITPALGSPPGQMTYSVFSTGTTTPVFSASLGPVAQNSFGINNLSANTFSVNGFDGSCKYTNSFVIVNYLNNFTLTPGNTTLCPGQYLAAGTTFTSPPSPGQYTYSWSPNAFIPGNTQQSTIIQPNTPVPGSINSIVYTVVVTPSIINCPMSETMSIVWANPVTPSFAPIPILCQNSLGYTISANPSGGIFNTSLFNGQSPINPLSGVITTSVAPIGINTFSYSAGVGTCVASSTATYQISGPQITVSPFTTICANQSATLLASGANSYTWSNGSLNYSTVVSPTANNTYYVIGSMNSSTCTSIQSTSVQLLALPILSLSGNQTICNFQTTTLTASGAASYTWNNGVTNSSCVVQPSTSTLFTVLGTSSLGCINSGTILVNVNYGPLLQVKGSTVICKGETVTMIAQGANNYLWSWSQASINPTLTLTPLITTIYTLSGSSFSNPCTSQIQHTVFVEDCIGFDELEKNVIELKVYPNPSSGIFTIESAGQTEISVYNALGQFLFAKTTEGGTTELNLKKYPNGIYFIHLGESAQRIRVIKSD